MSFAARHRINPLLMGLLIINGARKRRHVVQSGGVADMDWPFIRAREAAARAQHAGPAVDGV